MTDPIALVLTAILAGLLLMNVSFLKPGFGIPTLTVLGIICCRPTFLGERYPTLGGVLLIAAGVLSLVTSPWRTSRRGLAIPFIFVAAYGWLLFHSQLVPGSEPALRSILESTVLPVVAFCFLARNYVTLERVRTILVALVTIAAGLTAVSFILGLAVGFGGLKLGVLPVGYRYSDSALLAPGAFIYGPAISSIPRFLGLGREPGMGAIFIAWAFFSLPTGWRRSIRTTAQVLLIVALLATQSTSGIGVFGAVFALYAVFGRERFRPGTAVTAGIAAVALLWVVIFNPNFGFLAKTESGLSYSDRIAATAQGWTALENGQFFTAHTELPLSNVNLIAGISAHGIPFAVFILALFIVAIIGSGRTNPMTYAVMFMLITALTSQPIIDETGIFIMVILCYFLSGQNRVDDAANNGTRVFSSSSFEDLRMSSDHSLRRQFSLLSDSSVPRLPLLKRPLNLVP